MKMSRERSADLYAAISGPITELRIKLLRERCSTKIDDELFNLEITIWHHVSQALNIESPEEKEAPE